MNERADIIQAELRACTTRVEVKAVSDKHRDEVVAMYENKETRVNALHIINLKSYILDGFDQR